MSKRNTSPRSQSPQAYYATPGLLTSVGAYADLVAQLPTDLSALVNALQGLMVHIFWAGAYGLTLSEERKAEVNLRDTRDRLARIVALDDRPLTMRRPPERRVVANCRDFATTLTAILRHRGIPARARCGFGTYFLPNHYEDHWVIEHWDAAEARWVMLDPQIDAIMRDKLHLDFDPLDMPPGKFVTGGEAWQMCRRGEADPDAFGIQDIHGLWFVGGDLIRDFMSLNKVETLPWDHEFGYLQGGGDEQLMDRIAALAVGVDGTFAEVRRLYDADSGFHPPAEWSRA